MRVLVLPLALALVGCGGNDRSPASSSQAGAPTGTLTGPEALVLRIARTGGGPRVYRYPGVDSVVWTTGETAPAPASMLAFDDENGLLAYEDSRGRPVLVDLRLGGISVPTTKKLTGLASANARAIYGIAANGDVVRTTPSGDWTLAPGRPARVVYPQPDGGLLVATGTGANTRLLKLIPPEKRILDSIDFPVASRTVRTQLGDRLYLAVDSGLVVLRTRTMDWAPPIPFDEPITVMASTPSGDRVFVLTESGRTISVVDRFRDRVTAEADLPGKAEDLRVDPFGRYLLARASTGDSVWVLAIGTQRIIGSVRSGWRGDLPFVGQDGAVVTVTGNDVVLHDGETLRVRRRVRDGARDVWFAIAWDGLRPRAAGLDEPVRFDSIVTDSMALMDTTALLDTTTRGVSPTDPAEGTGFFVSFAAYLSEARARDLAGRIQVGGETARVISTQRDGATVYRVVLGPFLSRDEADRAGRESRQSFWVFEGRP